MADRLAQMDDEEEDDEEDDDADWASHTLKFEKTAYDRRRENAEMASLETRDTRAPGTGDNRSLHERRLRPEKKGFGGSGGDRGASGGGKGKGGVNSSRW